MNNPESQLRPLESMLRSAKPSPLAPGPHREQLARQLRTRAAFSADVPAWPMRHYLMAFALGILCLILGLLFHPRMANTDSFREQRQILASLLPDTGPVIVSSNQSLALPPRRLALPASHISPSELLEKIQERRRDLIQVMGETSAPTDKP